MNVRLVAAASMIAAACALQVHAQDAKRSAENEQSQARTWTDSTGAFTVEAELVAFDHLTGEVQLRRTDGEIIKIPIEKLSEADQKIVRGQSKGSDEDADSTVLATQLSGKPQELKRDDDKPAGKKSFPRGHAVAFDAPGDDFYLTSVRIHGGRYGYPQAPKEDFHISLCDKDFKLIADFPFPYSKFAYGEPKWVSFRVKPTKTPSSFTICAGFNPTRTKGVFVSHDAQGKALVGLPNKLAGDFTGGDWLIRVTVDQLKDAAAKQ